MTSHFYVPSQRYESSDTPPPLDEGYWAAILDEGDSVRSQPSEPTFAPASDDEIPPYSTQSLAADWEQVAALMTADETLEAGVMGCNRGGLLVSWESLHGFVPASQLINFPATTSLSERRRALEQYIGENLQVRVIELDQVHNRLILSERAARALPGGRADILYRLHPGDTTHGMVTNLCDFGAFIDLGGIEGLIHISELSWGRVGHPADILQRGQQVHVQVLEVNQESRRIALSLKRMHPDPWETVENRYQIGEFVHGVITNVVDFGAFARIEEGLEGLIHVSELAEGHFMHPLNVVHEGQEVSARILSIDGRSRRLGLSLRAAE